MAIALTALSQKVYQLGYGLNTSTVPLAGTYTGGAPTGIEAQVILNADSSTVLDWTRCTGESIGAGAWSGNLPGVPVGGEYKVKVRDVAVPGTVITGGTTWCAGDIWLDFGQSNMDGAYNADVDVSITPLSNTYFYNWDETWHSAGSTEPTTAFLNEYKTLTGRPVAIIRASIPASPLSNWLSSWIEHLWGSIAPGGGGFWIDHAALARHSQYHPRADCD
jgi:hypothetical protein